MCGGHYPPPPQYAAPAATPDPNAAAAAAAATATQSTQDRLKNANAAGFGTNILTGGLGATGGTTTGGASVLGATAQ